MTSVMAFAGITCDNGRTTTKRPAPHRRCERRITRNGPDHHEAVGGVMAVTKRTRFEVLRRDNYTCRYCRSAEGALTVDHVTPVALGGGDDPSNLVAACKDCNAGKSSSAPDATTVAQVSDDAIRWAKAMRAAADEALVEFKERDEYLQLFVRRWGIYNADLAWLPGGWESTVAGWLERGMPATLVAESIDIAMSATWVRTKDTFPYCCGVVRKKFEALVARAAEIVEPA